jgi:hypothetical protein
MKINEYKKLLIEHRFYEAHEILEEFWFPRRRQKDNLTLIAKGFINAAVAFELKKRGRDKNSLKVWQTYIKFMSLLNKMPDRELLELKEFVDNFAKKFLFEN